MRQIIVMILLAACLLLFSGMSLLTGKYYLSSFEGKVVDSGTKEPIEGAAVLAVYYKVGSTIAGSVTRAVDAQETLTDPDGQFKIPSKAGRSDDYRGKLECNLIIFKPGYGTFPDHELSMAVGENKSWPSPEKYVVYELPKLITREDRIKNMHHTSRPFHITNEKMEKFTYILNGERIALGYSPLVIQKEERVK
jgi:hypothetical protein